MNATLIIALLTTAPAAPVPREKPPNPLGWSYMGVRVQNIDGGPLQINAPDPGTPAYKAGLQAGDILLRIGRLTPNNFDEVIRYIFELRPGTVIEIEVKRGSEIIQKKLRLEERPNSVEYRLPDFIRRINPNLPVDDDD